MNSEASDLLGSYQSTKDTSIRMSGCSFTIPKGSIITVNQQDGDKILVYAGPSNAGWKHKRFLRSFERLD